jgi:hypothetical protein
LLRRARRTLRQSPEHQRPCDDRHAADESRVGRPPSLGEHVESVSDRPIRRYRGQAEAARMDYRERLTSGRSRRQALTRV